MKPLTTEKEAWRYSARHIARRLKMWRRGDGAFLGGLCYQVVRLKNLGAISLVVEFECFASISRYRIQHGIKAGYFWPLTKAGAKRRLAFCQEHSAK